MTQIIAKYTFVLYIIELSLLVRVVMKAAFLIFICIVLLGNLMYGQDPDYPLIEVGYIQYDDYQKDIISSGSIRNLYSYTEKGMLLIYKTLSYIKETNEWNIDQAGKNYYNSNDQLVGQKFDDYFGEAELHEDIALEYENGILRTKKINRIYTYDDYESESTSIEYYDDQGRNYKTIGESLDESGNINRKTSTSEWDINGCFEFHSSNIEKVNMANNIIEPVSQFYWEAAYIKDCLPVRIADYSSKTGTGNMEIVELLKWEYDFDSFGNILRERKYRNVEDWDTTLILEYDNTNIYDDLGNKTGSKGIWLGNDRNRYRTSTDFDLSGNEIKYYQEDYDFDNERWIPSYLTFSYYNTKNNFTKRETFLKYDTLSNDYLINRKSERIYNNDDQIEYSYYISIDSSGSQTIVTELESNYEYDCEGRFKDKKQKDIILNTIRSRDYRLYLDTPECELPQSSEIPFTLFPNPAQSYIHITLNEIIEDPKISLTDLNGKTIHSQYFPYNNVYSLNISHLLPGIYFFTVKSDSELYTVKFIKS